LFNALNTIVAVTRTNPAQARELLVHLSHFFRKNLAHGHDFSTLEEEIEHVSAYLEIEKARFRERLCVEFDLDPSLLNMKLPTFTLQPLIENAIKHGLSETIEPLSVHIRARKEGDIAYIDVEDDAGVYVESAGKGFGMKIVDQRIKNLFGSNYGTSVCCVANEYTRVTVKVPAKGVEA
jgi:two-component system LytT family sensor kinase